MYIPTLYRVYLALFAWFNHYTPYSESVVTDGWMEKMDVRTEYAPR